MDWFSIKGYKQAMIKNHGSKMSKKVRPGHAGQDDD